MTPWLWNWSPQLHFPWSGSVAQNIEPNTSWFSALIPPGAGNAGIEQKAFGVASYGKQLGHLTDLLLALAADGRPLDAKAQYAHDELQRIRSEIEAIKTAEYAASAGRLLRALSELKQRGGTDYDQLRAQLQALLAD